MNGCDTGAIRAPNRWLHLRAAARLLGRDVALVSRRARKGDYGIVSRDPGTREVLVSLRGLELTARRTWSIDQVVAARLNKPLPPDPYNYVNRLGPFPEGIPSYTPNMICAETAVADPGPLDDGTEPELITDETEEN